MKRAVRRRCSPSTTGNGLRDAARATAASDRSATRRTSASGAGAVERSGASASRAGSSRLSARRPRPHADRVVGQREHLGVAALSPYAHSSTSSLAEIARAGGVAFSAPRQFAAEQPAGARARARRPRARCTARASTPSDAADRRRGRRRATPTRSRPRALRAGATRGVSRVSARCSIARAPRRTRRRGLRTSACGRPAEQPCEHALLRGVAVAAPVAASASARRGGRARPQPRAASPATDARNGNERVAPGQRAVEVERGDGRAAHAASDRAGGGTPRAGTWRSTDIT